MRLLLLCILLCIQNVSAQVIGEIKRLNGEVYILNSKDDSAIKVSKGQKINYGDTVETKEKSFIQIDLNDNSIISLGANSKAKLFISKKKKVELVNLISGSIRSFIEKKKKEEKFSYIVKTRFSALAVRGTDFTAIIDSQKEMVTAYVDDGEVGFSKDATPFPTDEKEFPSFSKNIRDTQTDKSSQLIKKDFYSELDAKNELPTVPKPNKEGLFERISLDFGGFSFLLITADEIKFSVYANTFFRELNSKRKSTQGSAKLRSNAAIGFGGDCRTKFTKNYSTEIRASLYTSSYAENSLLSFSDKDRRFAYSNLFFHMFRKINDSFSIGAGYYVARDKFMTGQSADGVSTIDSAIFHGPGIKLNFNKKMESFIIKEMSLAVNYHYLLDNKSFGLDSGKLIETILEMDRPIFGFDTFGRVNFDYLDQDQKYFTNKRFLGAFSLGLRL